jgi:2-(1,2-epoxy-1,2-dihydrophenyl)acetyl-CoA isomerase
MERLRSLEIPVIAAVDGPAVGAGFSIALAADFVLASSRAWFCMSFVKIGLVPDLGAFHFLPRVVGMAKAKELAFTGRRVGAAEAEQLGIVHSIHDANMLQVRALAFAHRFVAAPREAIGLSKGLFNKSYETPYATLADLECQAQAIASSSAYHVEAVNGFLRGDPAGFDWDRVSTG